MRKFRCPFCKYEHTFSPKDKTRFKKRVVGFTCPSCGKKASDKDFRKTKGKGPKPPGERRKRKKRVDKIPQPLTSPIKPRLPITDNNDIEWRQKGQQYRPPSETGHPSANRYWQPHPTTRTLGDAALFMTALEAADMVNVKMTPDPEKEKDIAKKRREDGKSPR